MDTECYTMQLKGIDLIFGNESPFQCVVYNTVYSWWCQFCKVKPSLEIFACAGDVLSFFIFSLFPFCRGKLVCT